MTTYTWQESDLFGTSDLLAAAGSVIAAWNLCEVVIDAMLARFIRPNELSSAVFRNMHNAARLEVLREAGDASGEPLSELLSEFTTQAAICIENRNLIAHATYMPDWENLDQGGRVLRKPSSSDPKKINTFPVDAETMLATANACFEVSQFGLRISRWLAAQPGGPMEWFELPFAPTPLPDKPPRPRKLNPRTPSDPDSVLARLQSLQR